MNGWAGSHAGMEKVCCVPEMEATMNQQDVQLPMSSLLVNQRLQCMLQQMIPLTVEKQRFNVDSKLQ
jgi:hypothetical protein